MTLLPLIESALEPFKVVPHWAKFSRCRGVLQARTNARAQGAGGHYDRMANSETII